MNEFQVARIFPQRMYKPRGSLEVAAERGGAGEEEVSDIKVMSCTTRIVFCSTSAVLHRSRDWGRPLLQAQQCTCQHLHYQLQGKSDQPGELHQQKENYIS